MPETVISSVVENVHKYQIPGVRFIRWGEPTLHPQYITFMEKIKSAGALIHINTNGSLLNDAQMEQLYEIHLDSIKFSFQGANEGTYNEMRKGGDYKKLLSQIRKFYEMRGERDFPYIQISTTLTTESREEVTDFINDVGNYCDYYNIGHTKLNHLDIDLMNISDADKDKIRSLKERETNHHQHFKVCPEAFDKLSVNWNGDVTLCCSDYDNYMVVGNILHQDLKELFLCEKADSLRKILVKEEYDKIPCCKNCYELVPLTK